MSELDTTARARNLEKEMARLRSRLQEAEAALASLHADGAGSECALGALGETAVAPADEAVASELLARSILNQVAEAIVVCDPEGRIVRTSHEADRLTGGSALYRRFPDALPLRLPDGVPFSLSPVMQGEILQGFEVTLQRTDADATHLLLSAGPVLGHDGVILGSVVTLVDITPRKRFEAALRSQSEALARSNAALKQFAYVASHDLQEPLRMISNYVQLIQQRYRGKLDKDADQFIRYAAEGAMRMHTLLNDLLDYSKVDLEPLNLAPVDCRLPLEAALTKLRTLAEQHGASVSYGEMPWIEGDYHQLVQLFQNILSNAIKFHGESAPRIQIEAGAKGRQWRFSVRDNGIGMEPAYLDRIFTIFQRLHSREQYSGNGIGLAICKRIVERHGGSIWVSSAPGQGATFYFTLPAAEPPTTGPDPLPPLKDTRSVDSPPPPP